MTTEETNEQNPFTRPGFLMAAAFVALLVTAGIVLGVFAMNRDDTPESSTPTVTASDNAETPSESPTSDGTGAAADASVCGLPEGDGATRLDQAPATEWQYQGTTAYPTSEAAGPGATSEEQVRYCFQRSPEGALYAAANGLVQATDPAVTEPWMNQFLAEGTYRDQILADNETSSEGSSSGSRMTIAGYKILQYNDDSAVVDVAVNASTQGQNVVGSFVYSLVWQEGDWKLSAETLSPFAFQTLPDLAGYISWGE